MLILSIVIGWKFLAANQNAYKWTDRKCWQKLFIGQGPRANLIKPLRA